jgi:cytochrome c2
MTAAKIIFLAIVSLLIVACSATDKQTKNLSNPNNLPAQSFTIKAGKDTVISTKGGIQVLVKKGTFDVDVDIEIKEATTFADMAKYGLTTMADGKLLSSDGMFYINAADANGKQAKMNKPIEVTVPATTMLDNPQLFKGAQDSSGNVNWVNPQKIPNDSIFKTITSGEKMFNTICSSCHSIGGGKSIGPDLKYIHKRRTYQWFSDFTRNPQAMLKKGDACAQCIADKYNMAIMPPQTVSDKEMLSLWKYIMKENYKIKEDTNNLEYLDCTVEKEILRPVKPISRTPDSLNATSVDEDVIEIIGPNSEERIKKVMKNISYLYSLQINDWGWYNIDSFLEPTQYTKETRLEITAEDITKYTQIEVKLFVPQSKINAHLKPLEKKYYGYDGTVFLPTNQNLYVFATAIKGEDFYSVIQKITIGENGLTRYTVKLEKTTTDALEKQLDQLFGVKVKKPEVLPTVSLDTITMGEEGYHGEKKKYLKKKVRVPCGLIENTVLDTAPKMEGDSTKRRIKIKASPAPGRAANY